MGAMENTMPADGAAEGVGPNILIVDDNRPLVRGLVYLFRDAGCRTTTFFEGIASIEYARTHKVAAAVIDVHLPDINGLVLSGQLRDVLGPQTPIIILSGDGSMEVLNSLPLVGATYFFCKPVNGTMLVERVRELLQ